MGSGLNGLAALQELLYRSPLRVRHQFAAAVRAVVVPERPPAHMAATRRGTASAAAASGLCSWTKSGYYAK